jgi:hypothetical protein
MQLAATTSASAPGLLRIVATGLVYTNTRIVEEGQPWPPSTEGCPSY